MMEKTSCYTQRIKATDPNFNIWVSASAGTGKTSLLINRIIRILLTGVNPSKIIAITYTNAAALEIKERVMSRLVHYQNISSDKLRDELNFLTNGDVSEEMLVRARELYLKCHAANQGLKIQTIHSFALNILTEFSKEAGLFAGFKIASHNQQEKMLKAARLELLNNEAAQESIIYLARKLNFVQITDLLSSIISARNKIIYLLFKAGSVSQLLNNIKEQAGIYEESEEKLQELFIEQCDFGVIANLCEMITNYGSAKEIESVTGYREILDSNVNSQIINFLQSLFMTQKGSLKKSLVTKAVQNQIADYFAVEELAESLVNHIQDCNALTIYKDTEAIIIIATLFLEIHEKIKKDDNLIDYDDVILRMLRLLFSSSEREWVIYHLRDQISHLLIDEAQDTSPSQWDIVKELVNNLVTNNKDFLKSIFIVGDEKQSIFSFQGADFRSFQNNYDDLQNILKEYQQEFQFIRLQNSFRSQPLILEFVDSIFANYELYKNLTTAAEWNQHNPQRSNDQFAETMIFPLTEAKKIVSKREEWDFPEEILAKENDQLDLAQQISAHIQKVHKQQNVAYGDIMVLVRNRNQLYYALQEEFTKLDLPYGSDEEICLNEHIIFMDIVALARFCLTPEDDYNLAALLKSPFCGISEDELFTLCYDRGEENLFARLEQQHPKISQKLITIKDEFITSDYLEIYLRLLNDDRIIAEYNAEFGAITTNILISKIKEELWNAKNEDVISLKELVEYLTETNKRIKLNTKASDKIALLTIHAAKGLQAKLVIIADLNFNLRKTPSDMILFADEVMLANIRSLPFSLRDTMIENLKEMNYSENLRLIYVALTRAEDKLHIFGLQNDKGFYQYFSDLPLSLGYEELADNHFFKGIISRYDDFKEREKTNAIELNIDLAEADIILEASKDDDNYETLLGSYMHNIWQQLIHCRKVPDVVFLLDQINEENWLKKQDKEVFSLALQEFVESDFWQNLQNNYRLKTEVAIVANGQTYRVDYLAMSDDEIIILELKTDKDINLAMSKYRQQLENYQEIISSIYQNKKVKSYLLSLRNNKFYTVKDIS